MWDTFVGLVQEALIVCYKVGLSLGIESYGAAIIIFTIIIKVLMFPITMKQIKSTKAMQDIQPKMKALQEKYKNDKDRLQQEMLKLYKDTGFNPLAGCLPLVAQMPILIGVFYALRDFDYGNVVPSFMWLPSLAAPDPIYVLPVLSALTTFVQSYLTMPDLNSSQNKMMLYFMPIFIGYISLQFPSGLVLYWTITNLLQILQQLWFTHKEKQVA